MHKLLRIQIALVSLVIFTIISIILMNIDMIYLQNCLLVAVLIFNTLLSFLYVITNSLSKRELYNEIATSFVMIFSTIYVYTHYIR
jgi:hypothetical protein